MKTFTYVAAIALLAAGTAFAQSSNNSSTINNSTPTPSATGPADSAGTMSNQSAKPVLGGKQSGSMNQSGSMGMDKSSGSMDQSMDQSSGKAPKHASKAKSHHVASARSGGNDSKENQETMQLNRQQAAGSSSMNGASGMNASGNSFNNGSPQQAQAGGANCTPDNPSCGTARQNPAINSSPQHRTYGDQQ